MGFGSNCSKIKSIHTIDSDGFMSIELEALPSLSVSKLMYSDNPGKHFLIWFDRIMSTRYRPTLKDILNLKDPTSGIFKFIMKFVVRIS